MSREDPARTVKLRDAKLLTVAEVAVMMRVSKMTVYRLIREGLLEAVQVGRGYRIPETSADYYLAHAWVSDGGPG